MPGWVEQLPIAGEYLDRWWQTNVSNPRAVVEWLRGVNMESVGWAHTQRVFRRLLDPVFGPDSDAFRPVRGGVGSTCQAMSIWPAASFESAPCFAALVASSWNTIARVNA
jgi:hypothetical protein